MVSGVKRTLETLKITILKDLRGAKMLSRNSIGVGSVLNNLAK